MNKEELRQQILARLREELLLQRRAAETSRNEAIDEESRPQNRYDTHSQEAAYLAEGQARLAAELAASIELYETLPLPAMPTGAAVGVGAIVRVDDGSAATWYFIGPRAGGLELQVDGTPVLVLTPPSPVGRELLGKHVGDPVKLPTPGASLLERIGAIE